MSIFWVQNTLNPSAKYTEPGCKIHRILGARYTEPSTKAFTLRRIYLWNRYIIICLNSSRIDFNDTYNMRYIYNNT